MVLKSVPNLIYLNLTNISSTDSEINLFKTNPNSNDSTDTYFKTTYAYYPTAELSIYVDGVQTLSNYFGATISQQVQSMNDSLGEFLTFTYELVSGSGIGAIYNLIVKQLNTSYVLTYVNTNQNYYSTEYTTALDSTISINSTNGLSYNELCSEISVHPYRIDKVGVFSPDQTQLLERFKKVSVQSNGISNTDFNYQILDPYQKQNILTNIETDFIPSSLSYLNYRVLGSQSVSMYLYYSTTQLEKPLLEVDSKNTIALNDIKKTKKIIVMSRKIVSTTPPLISLVNNQKQVIKKASSLKEALKNSLGEKPTNEDVFNAFEGSDYIKH